MPMSTSFIASEDRLDLSFQGDLDLTISEEVCLIAENIPTGLRTCIMDLTRLDRVFDSGIALLLMLNERLQRLGCTVVLLSDHPDILRRAPLIMTNAVTVVPQDSPIILNGRMRLSSAISA